MTTAYIPIFTSGAGFSLSALRSLRVLRPLRTISSIKKLKTLIITIVNAIPNLVEILVIIIFTFLIFAIAGLQLFSGILKRRCYQEDTGVTYTHPEIICNGTNDCPGGFICGKQIENPYYGVNNFDDVGSSFLMVFQMTTMEGWTLVMIQLQQAFTPLVI